MIKNNEWENETFLQSSEGQGPESWCNIPIREFKPLNGLAVQKNASYQNQKIIIKSG